MACRTEGPVSDQPQLALTVTQNGYVVFETRATDPAGKRLTFTASAPEHGVVTGEGPGFTYAPAANYVGPDAFEVTISNGSASATVSITVTVVRAAPAASDQAISTLQDTPVTITLRATSTATLTYTVVTPPTHGALSGSAPTLTYTPTRHFSGTDSFTFRASDGTQSSALAQVTLTVTHVVTCGDGVVEGTEACDDGNDVDTDACRNGCLSAVCGDGVVQAGVEGCDDGNQVDTDGCRDSCALPSCGDGVLHAGEACDDGNQINTDGCLNTCMVASCGDAVVQAGVEQCDDGNQVDTDGCRTSCQSAACGDGVVQAGVEACDDANHIDTDACLSTCQAASCGDGYVEAGVEACDDGNQLDTDGCRDSCQPAACGDGVVHAGVEQCDDGNQVETDACLGSCRAAACGDGVVQAGVEQCDDGNQVDSDGCRNTCALPSCGDGVVQVGVEQCDDGNNDNTDGCLSTCVPAACGDGFVEQGVETCDDGNAVDGDGCSHRCDIERCGDHVTQLGLGETCDDGNTVAGDGCDAQCSVEPFTTTVPVKVSGDLSCTTSTANAARKLAVDGSGVIYAGLRCGTEAFVALSTDRGASFSAPTSLSADVPNGPVTVSQLALAATTSGTAYAAIQLNTGEVFLRSSTDRGASWTSPVSVGQAISTSSGLSLAAFNDTVYVGFSTSGGVSVARNFASGVGAFETTAVSMSIAFFDLTWDVTTNTLAVCADTPTFHIRTSTDGAATFAPEVNPPGSQYYSDWAIGGGTIYTVGINLGASGNATLLYAIPTTALTTSTSVGGLPAVSTAQTRTVAANDNGDAFVASQLNSGGVQLDHLVAGGTSLDTARSLSATGGSPIVVALPGRAGAAVEYTDGTSVYVTIQAY